MLTCCFTGHRAIRQQDEGDLARRLCDCTEELIERYGAVCFRCGGALGFDTLAALSVLEAKAKYPACHVRLELFLPCRDQTKGWRPEDVACYEDILRRADAVVYASEEYTRTCMHLRNRMLVDGSDLCLAYLYESRGGTHYTCTYARERHVPVLNLVSLLEDGKGNATQGAT